MARIQIADLPPVEPITAEEVMEIFGAGRSHSTDKFPPYPPALLSKMWLDLAKKLKVEGDDVAEALEDVHKEYAKIKLNETTFAPLKRLKNADDLAHVRSATQAELKHLPALNKRLTELSTCAAKSAAHLKKDKANAQIIRLAEKIQQAAADFYDEVKDIDDWIDTLLDEADENLSEQAPEPEMDKFLVVGLKLVKSRPGLFALAVGKTMHLVMGAKLPAALLQQAKALSGGGRFVRGACVFDKAKSAYVFQLAVNPPGGLAKKIKTAILKQTLNKFRVQVIVRGPEGAEVDDAQDAEELAADAPLEDVEEPGEGLVQPANAPPAARGAVGANTGYAQLLLAWEKAQKSARADLDKLKRAIIAEVGGEPDFADIESRLKRLDKVLARFDGRLKDVLDDAVNTPATGRADLHRRARSIISEYSNYVENDPFLTDLQENPFVPIQVRPKLALTLGLLEKKLVV